MRVCACNDRILVEMESTPVADVGVGSGLKTTSGGLVMPDEAHESVMGVGRILSVGPGEWRKHKGDWVRVPVTDVKAGDRVLFIKFHQVTETSKATQRALRDKNTFFLQPDDLLAVVEDDTPAHQLVG